MNKKKWISALLACILIFQGSTMAWAGSPVKPAEDPAVINALQYLKSVQNLDGGFPMKKGEKSSLTATTWAVMGIAAAGQSLSSWKKWFNSPASYMNLSQESPVTTTDYARLLIARTLSGLDPVHRGINLKDKLQSFQQKDGSFYQLDVGEKGALNAHIWAILALKTVGSTPKDPAKALLYLKLSQNSDGGFGWAAGMDSDTDDTAVAIQAMKILGEKPESSAVIKKAVAYLKTYQQKNGGFSAGSWMGKVANAASDSWVIQGLVAAGENPTGSAWTIGGNTPVTHLASCQDPAGFFNWKPGVVSNPVQITAYALMALKRKSHPLPRIAP